MSVCSHLYIYIQLGLKEELEEDRYVHVWYKCIFNSYTMGTRGLPDIYILSPWACGPRALGVYIRGEPRVHMV